MNNLMDIIINGEQLFEYRLSFAFEPTDKQIDRIKQEFSKYDIVDTTPLTHTIFQTKPIDFPQLDAGEIWMIDVTPKRALVLTIAIVEVSEAMNAPIEMIRIRNRADTLKEYNDMLANDIKFDAECDPVITDPDYSNYVNVDLSDAMGDELADKAAASGKSDANNGYSEYMVAGFEKMFPKTKADVKADAGPTKE